MRSAYPGDVTLSVDEMGYGIEAMTGAAAVELSLLPARCAYLVAESSEAGVRLARAGGEGHGGRVA